VTLSEATGGWTFLTNHAHVLDVEALIGLVVGPKA